MDDRIRRRGRGVESVDYFDGATVVRTGYSPSDFGAITLGSYIIGTNDIRADPSNDLFKHEYGHYLQSQTSGFKYLFKYGIPSYKSAKGDGIHKYFRTELNASFRAHEYFKNSGHEWWYYKYHLKKPSFNINGNHKYYSNSIIMLMNLNRLKI